MTGEVAEYVAATTMGLELTPPRTKGYDGIRRIPASDVRIQIKGRAYGPSAANRSAWGRSSPKDLAIR
ncbi:hypothetical protein [Mesorhizobium australicum]|uniref:hypothetical protein n=1 Tax=Mesorhizobium australicum TaxID=536018 RepID=UPI001AECAA58|nr:hypothetical protein [Mesorhizobium australicum]